MASTQKGGHASAAREASLPGNAEELAAILLARTPREDLAAYDDAALRAACETAYQALKRHRPGESVVAVYAGSGVMREGRPVTLVTLVNDNMPFLFDSVMAELADTGLETLLVAHPVLSGSAAPRSLIHIHLRALSEERAAALARRFEAIFAQVRSAVKGWKPMLARLERQISDYRYGNVPLAETAVSEAIAFLEWLRDDNFVFLGMRDYLYSGDAETGELARDGAVGLGILADPDLLVLRRGTEAVTTTPEVRKFLHGDEPLIVTKANTRSLVHRRVYLDYVGIKTFDPAGALTGELRIVGLFTSTAYTRSVMRIPYLRSKAATVIARLGFDAEDHSGKALINILESYPRDELFQIPVNVLRRHAEAILALGERPRIRALVREDQFDRFVSVLVYVPRDRYDSRVRERIGDHLKTVFDGRLSAYYPAFPEGTLARVHFIIGRSGGRTPKVDPAKIEAAIAAIVRTWDDALADAAETAGADADLLAAASRFPESYRSSFSAFEALEDARIALAVGAERPIATDFRRRTGQAQTATSLKIFHRGAAVPLSRRVPMLENMGFRVISERTFELDLDGGTVFMHDMELESARGTPIDLADGGQLFEAVFLSVWTAESDDDAYNALAQFAGLGARDIAMLRACGRYLQQAGIPQSPDFVAGVLNRYPKIAEDLHALFVARHDPALDADRTEAENRLVASVESALDAVPNADDDAIIRRFLNLIASTLRTNHFRTPRPGERVSFAMKLDAGKVTGLPDPRPWREIFVYGPEVEGVHLRFGPVARGGLRWSDRAQDYRTEVLGLVKAQQVKNAVIVPVGAKGGFYPKRLPPGGSRETVFQAGTAAYVNFVTSLLSITDNLDIDRVVPPEGVVRHDGDDPYFVVAADKGTATFSDTANAISQAHGFWLDDAFASGGSAGYDHKKMGITARGAWEAVKRHFREMNRDIQKEPFTVAGVGDMSGDVFGNGMLLSPEIRLVAAFDHRDIFIDPDPDAAASLAERTRLFGLPRSSWQDYEKSAISPGGGVFSRAQKQITLSQGAAAAIGLDRLTASPTEILNAILKAPVDLLWFGGIGTYVRGPGESNAEVGDRANDAIRVEAAEVRAKVVGEGANLGMTQRARIAYGLAGGRCNSDAIDNSGGVNSSDLEVNIKIALAAPMRSGRLERADRNTLLASMTDEVATHVLANNYEQTLAISLSERRGESELAHQQRFMRALEARNLLDRDVETLPSDKALAERTARRQPLTRAEIGVLLAYAKIALFQDLVASGVPDESAVEADLLAYFPETMRGPWGDDIRAHRLRREIIATQLANDVINRGGPTFVTRLMDLTGATAADVVEAYVIAREGFGTPAILAEIDALDGRIGGQEQLGLYQAVGRFVSRMTAWLLKNGRIDAPVSDRIEALRKARQAAEPVLSSVVPLERAGEIAARTAKLSGKGAPETLARTLARLDMAEIIPEAALLAHRSGVDPVDAIAAYFRVGDALGIDRVVDASRSIPITDYFDGLALSRAGDIIAAARRSIVAAALTRNPASADPVAAWMTAGGDRVARGKERLAALTDGGDLTLSRLSVAAGVVQDLSTL